MLVAIKELISVAHVEGTPIRDHVLNIISLLNELEIQGAKIDGKPRSILFLTRCSLRVLCSFALTILWPIKFNFDRTS